MRKVGVVLEADVGGYLVPVIRAAEATEKLDDKVEGLDRDLNKIPLDAAKAGAAMKLLGGDVNDVGKKFETLGDKSTAMGLLDVRIKTARAEVKKLGEEFVKTGDIEVFKHLGKADADLRALQTVRRGLADAIKGGASDGGGQFASTFASFVQGGVLKALLNPIGAILAASIAVPLVLELGAAVGGLSVAAGAAGAVGLGVAGAAMQSKQVGEAWTAEIAKIKAQWLDASKSFVGPTTEAIHTLGTAVEEIHLDKMLAAASRYVAPIAEGIAGAMASLGAGIDYLVERAGPEVEVLRTELPKLGHSVEVALEAIGEGSEGGAQGLKDLLRLTGAIIETTGKFVGWAESAYGAMRKFSIGIADTVDHLRETNGLLWVTLAPAKLAMSVFDPRQPDAFARSLKGVSGESTTLTQTIDGVTRTTEITTSTMDDLGKVGGDTFIGLDQKMHDAASTVERLNRAFDDSVGKVLDLNDANIAAAQGLADLKEGFKRGTDALDVGTQKGRDNLSLIDQTIANYARQRDAAIAAGGGTKEAFDKAREAYNKHIAELEVLIGKLLGSKAAAKAFMDQFYDKTVTVTVKVAKVVESGGKIPVPSGGLPFAMAEGGIRHAAAGLIVPPRDPGTVIMGEPQTGGELFLPLQGVSQMRAMGLAQVAGNNYGFDVTPRAAGGVQEIRHVVDIMGGGELIRRLVITAAQNRGQSVAQYLGT